MPSRPSAPLRARQRAARAALPGGAGAGLGRLPRAQARRTPPRATARPSGRTSSRSSTASAPPTRSPTRPTGTGRSGATGSSGRATPSSSPTRCSARARRGGPSTPPCSTPSRPTGWPRRRARGSPRPWSASRWPRATTALGARGRRLVRGRIARREPDARRRDRGGGRLPHRRRPGHIRFAVWARPRTRRAADRPGGPAALRDRDLQGDGDAGLRAGARPRAAHGASSTRASPALVAGMAGSERAEDSLHALLDIVGRRSRR